jgi:hypothetical protein
MKVLPHVDFYRSLLASVEDDGVVVITIGMFNTFADFLKSGADKYSELTGIELARKKIHAVVSMAAILPEGREFNVKCDHKAAEYCFENCPAPMYLSDFKVGESVYTGYDLKKSEKYVGNPIFDSYRLYTAGWQREGFNRSFDLTAVQFAFEGEGEIYSLGKSGELEFFNAAPNEFPESDATRFVEHENGNIRFIEKNASDRTIEQLLQARMDEFNWDN